MVDNFYKNKNINEIIEILSKVGFSSPPCWCKPYNVLSNGQKFRVDLARLLLEKDFIVIDEFTSVIDRQVAKIGSIAISKYLKNNDNNKKFIALSCHRDIIEYLQPDWIIDTDRMSFEYCNPRQRPKFELSIKKVNSQDYWHIFKKYHYLNTECKKTSDCFVGFIDNVPVGFCCVLHFPHPIKCYYKEHRTVVLPEYQGIGIGTRISNYIASLYGCKKSYAITTNNPAFKSAKHRDKNNWKCTQSNKINTTVKGTKKSFNKTRAKDRLVSTFVYIGDKNIQDAKNFNLI